MRRCSCGGKITATQPFQNPPWSKKPEQCMTCLVRAWQKLHGVK